MTADGFQTLLIAACATLVAAGWLALGSACRIEVNPGWVAASVVFAELGSLGLQVAGNQDGVNAAALVAIVVLISLPLVARKPRALFAILTQSQVVLWWTFLAVAGASLLWSQNPEYGAHKLMLMVATGIIPGVTAAFLASDGRSFGVHLFLAVGCLYSLAALTTGEDVVGRFATSGGNPIWVSRTALLLVAVAVWGRSWLLLRVAAIGLGLWLALKTGSRGPLLALIAAPLLLWANRLIFQALRGRFGSVVLQVISGTAIVLCFWIVNLSADTEMVHASRIGGLVDSSRLAGDEDVVARLDLQRHALSAFVESPILGAGLGGVAPRGTSLYPHNLPLELASEVGLLGLVVWSAALVGAWRAAKASRLVQILLLQVILYSCTSGDLGFNNYVPFFALFAIGAGRAQLGMASLRLRRRSPGADVIGDAELVAG